MKRRKITDTSVEPIESGFGAVVIGNLYRETSDRDAAVVDVTPGRRTAAQVARNTRLFEQPVPSGLWAALRAQGLVRADTTESQVC